MHATAGEETAGEESDAPSATRPEARVLPTPDGRIAASMAGCPRRPPGGYVRATAGEASSAPDTEQAAAICPLETPYDTLLQAWRDALAKKVPGGVCKHPRPKSAARLAQETIHRKFGRADLTDKRRHADRVAAKANLHARGARIRREATGGR